MAEDPRPLLVFFYSERSGPGRRIESLLAHLARKERERVRFRRVDVDLRPDLVARFKVDEVPTLVLVKGKRVTERLVGRVSSPCIERMLEAHLEPVAAIVVAALALIPGVGYLEALALPALGARLRRRGGERYAGLRILARD